VVVVVVDDPDDGGGAVVVELSSVVVVVLVTLWSLQPATTMAVEKSTATTAVRQREFTSFMWELPGDANGLVARWASRSTPGGRSELPTGKGPSL
jgi:hypothetical protein